MLSATRKSVRFVELEEGPSQQKQEVARREEEDPNTPAAPPSPTTPLQSRTATASSSQGRATLPASDSVTFRLKGDAGLEPDRPTGSAVAFGGSQSQAQADSDKGKSQVCPEALLQEIPSLHSEKSQPQGDPPEEFEAENGIYRVETRNYLREQGVVFKPECPFRQKLITVYAVSPLGETPRRHCSQKSRRFVHVHTSDSGKRTASQHAYIVLDSTSKKLESTEKGPKSNIIYLQLKPGCGRYIVPVRSAVDSRETKAQSDLLPCVARKATSATTTTTTTTTSTTSTTPPAEGKSGLTGMDIYTPVTTATLSRTQERAELQQLNDRFAAYVQRVRQLAEKNNNIDSSALIKSTKVLEIEIHNLKNMYEQELEKLRTELENCNHEKATHQVQVNKQLQYVSELQDRLSVETDKNGKLLDEINNYQRRIGSLEAEIQDLRIASSRPHADLDQLQRTVDNLTRENETWKHRYEHEQVARQEAENRIQQLMQKADFNEKVCAERVGELNSRIESAAATILSLEAKVRDLSKTDVSVSELLKQVRDTAEAELRQFRIESDEQYNRNLTALKAQLDSNAKTVELLETERSQLRGSVGELQARIRSLEGQLANMEHQKQTLEDAIAVERNRAADSARSLERKLREVQDMLVVKMREVTTAREQNIPLKAEIEALKALLEEEERRLRVPLGVTSSTPAPDPTSFVASYNITTTTTNTTAAPTTLTIASAPPPATTTTYAPMPPSSSAAFAPMMSTATAAANSVGFIGDSRPYVPSPPLSVNYIPEVLQMPGYEAAFSRHEEEMDPQLYGYTGTVPLAKYSYETTPAVNRLSVEPSPPTTPRPPGAVRAKSAPVHSGSASAPEQRRKQSEPVPAGHQAERQRYLSLVPANLGQGHDYFDQMFHDLQRDTLYHKDRPKSSPMQNQPLSSIYHDYTVSTSSATGDLKIFEVQQDGKYVRLLNDGVQEVEFGGFMLQQNVGGHPVAVFRFPPRTKFAPNSTITVYAGCNDHKLHNPPQDFVWKEQQKWGTGPECTTILCRPNGQAVAWTTAAHRFTRDAFQDGQSELDDDATKADEEKQLDEVADDESLTEIAVNVNGPKPDPVYLRREKQQPPSLQANKHPHGETPATPTHPHSVLPRPYRYGNDNSSNNRQSRSQSTRPDPVHGQPYAGAAGQKMGSAPLRKFVSGVSTQQPSAIRSTGKSEGAPGEATEVPSPFMKPHARFQSGLDQVQSQHHADFLPPMPRPPLFSTW